MNKNKEFKKLIHHFILPKLKKDKRNKYPLPRQQVEINHKKLLI